MKNNLKYILILCSLSYLFLILGNGIFSLTNPDEVFYAQTAKEMVQHHSWMTPYLFDKPQFEKPIFLYWMMRIAFIIFGINGFAARFFPAVFAFLGVIATYLLCVLGSKDQKKAFITSLIVMSSLLYIGLARTVFTDMIFSVFILFSMVSFFWAYERQGRKALGILLFFIFSALAVLTKGPLGILIPGPAVFLFLTIKKDLKFIGNKYFFWGLCLFILISLPWYILESIKYGRSFTHEFFYNDHIRRFLEAEHIENDKWYFYPSTMIWGMFPWSVYVAVALFYFFKKFRSHTGNLSVLLMCWMIVTFFTFQGAHSKLASYIFPLFPALAIMTGDFLYEGARLKNKKLLYCISSITAVFLVFILVCVGLSVTVLFSYVSHYISSRMPLYVLLALLSVLTALFLVFVIRRQFIKSIYALMCFLPVVISIVPLVKNDIEPFLSPKYSCEYLLKSYRVNNTILSSKFFVRAVKYYTDKDVAVINPYGKNFFSPHPVIFLDSDQKIAEFLRAQSVTYCILKKSSFIDIKRQSGEFNIEILKVLGNEYILRIEPLHKDHPQSVS